MKLKAEELFIYPKGTVPPKMIVISTNGIISKAGKLVMGRGCAMKLRDTIPGIDIEIANIIKEKRLSETIEPRMMKDKSFSTRIFNYGFLEIRNPLETGKTGIGVFQVKECWWENAQLWMIEESTRMLKMYAEEHPGFKIRMPLAGVGNGHLDRKLVIPILETLPDNVTVCYREE